MNISESIILAFDSIRINKLRASLTLLSISIGVFAIIGAGTLVSSLNGMVTSELSNIGETTFWFSRMPKIQTGNSWRKYQKRKPINYSQYKEFKKLITSTTFVSCHSSTEGVTVKYENLSTDADVSVLGCEEYTFKNFAFNVIEGRIITEEDITSNRNVAVIGNDVIVNIFPNESPIGKRIRVGNQNYDVIGILETKGATFGRSRDNMVIIPLTKFLTYNANEWEESLEISVKAVNKESLQSTMDESIGAMRIIRNDKPGVDNSFEISTNESLSEQFGSFMSYISYFGFFCGFVALIAAGIGITNIMLVSVKERTREIGIRKAIGAKKRWIMTQFIIETITLCQVGGFFGIIFGIGGASILGGIISLKIVFPVGWVIFSVVICTVLGLIAGVYPAMKAANLDPIDALRYE
jgi:putative ABC transport system permease protein